MPYQTLILSDTHLGKPSGPTAESLRPVWQGVDELVINGDAAEVQIPWLRGAAIRELEHLAELTQRDDVRLTLLSGNHDAYLTDKRHLQLAQGRILVMHGDALHPAVAPWTQHARVLADRTKQEITAAEHNDLPTRLDIAQHVGHSEFLKDYILSHAGEGPARRLLARPWEVPQVLWYWSQEPRLANRFLDHYAPDTKVLILGHSHRRAVWQRNGRTFINTGAFMFPGKPQCVLHQSNTLSVFRLNRHKTDYRRDTNPIFTLQDDYLADDAANRDRPIPHAA